MVTPESSSSFAAMTPEASAAKSLPPPWQRFTMLDILLLFVAYALGFGFLKSSAMYLGKVTEESPELNTMRLAIFFLVGLGLGSNFSAPIILGSQFFFRGRKYPLGIGEGFWLVSFGVITILFLVLSFKNSLYGNEFWEIPIFGIITIFVPLAAIKILVKIFRMKKIYPETPCLWTEYFGYFTHCLNSILIILLLQGFMRSYK
jgi:hypothetical protein